VEGALKNPINGGHPCGWVAAGLEAKQYSNTPILRIFVSSPKSDLQWPGEYHALFQYCVSFGNSPKDQHIQPLAMKFLLRLPVSSLSPLIFFCVYS
jgi:hypothetical protein